MVQMAHWCYRVLYTKIAQEHGCFQRNNNINNNNNSSSINGSSNSKTTVHELTTSKPSQTSFSTTIGAQTNVSTESSFLDGNADTTTDVEEYVCHQEFKTHSYLVVSLRFWLEGVLLMITGKWETQGHFIC